MWQRDWDQWRTQNFPDAKPAEYLSKKLLTNFTEDIHQELLEYENQFIAELNSKPKTTEAEQKSEQNNNKMESNQQNSPKIVASSPSTIPSRKNAVLKKLRQRKEERLKNALIPSRISKNQTALDSPVTLSTKDQESNSQLDSPRSFYNHGNKSPTEPQSDNLSPGSQNTCPVGGLFNTEPSQESENDIKAQRSNEFIPKRRHFKFKTRDDNDSDDDVLPNALANLNLRHHA